MCHVTDTPSLSNTHALTHSLAQKLLHNIQMKEQQRLIEAQLATMATHQLNSPDILSALKAMQQDSVAKEMGKQTGMSPPIFTAPTTIPEHIANPGRK